VAFLQRILSLKRTTPLFTHSLWVWFWYPHLKVDIIATLTSQPAAPRQPQTLTLNFSREAKFQAEPAAPAVIFDRQKVTDNDF
jgi:hypothetical protein